MKTASNNASQQRRLRAGDRVSIVRGNYEIEALVIEDRGNIGVGGRQLVRIRVEDDPGEFREFEAAAEETRLIAESN